MADERKIHPSFWRDAKVCALTDLERSVFLHYIVGANDFGVMPAEVATFQANSLILKKLPARQIAAALEGVLRVGLLLAFEHEGTRYVWSRKWQDYQGIRWPRKTAWPAPADLTAASPKTRAAFRTHAEKLRCGCSDTADGLPESSGEISEELPQSSGETSEVLPQNFGDSSEKLPPHACAPRARARNPNPHPNPDPGALGEESARETPPRVVRRDAEGRALSASGAWGPRHALGGGHHGSLVGDHRRCAPCAAAACGRGLCVPEKLIGQWRAQCASTTVDAEAFITAFVAEVLAALPPGPVGDDPLLFWRGAWQQAHGTRMAPPAAARAPRLTGHTDVDPRKYAGITEGDDVDVH